MTTSDVVQQAHAALDATSPGPWTAHVDLGEVRDSAGLRVADSLEVDADAEFIAWCRDGVPALVAEAERLRVEVDDLECKVECARQDRSTASRWYREVNAVRQTLRAQIDAVRSLHVEEATPAGGHPGGWCRGCHTDWPCPTIHALDGEVTP